MHRLLFADQQFFGVDHSPEEKARALGDIHHARRLAGRHWPAVATVLAGAR